MKDHIRVAMNYRRLIIAIIIIAIGAGAVLLYLGRAGTVSAPSPYGDILVPDQRQFRANDANREAIRWLASRWEVPEEQIYMIVQASEPWMQVVGLLDIQSLSSARIWILDTSQDKGRASELALARQGTPHERNIYLFTEYMPGESEKAVAGSFYSTKTFWYGRPLGGLAIIEDIHWTDMSNGSGSIVAYQSQKHLPSVKIPVRGHQPKKWQATQMPVH